MEKGAAHHTTSSWLSQQQLEHGVAWEEVQGHPGAVPAQALLCDPLHTAGRQYFVPFPVLLFATTTSHWTSVHTYFYQLAWLGPQGVSPGGAAGDRRLSALPSVPPTAELLHRPPLRRWRRVSGNAGAWKIS